MEKVLWAALLMLTLGLCSMENGDQATLYAGVGDGGPGLRISLDGAGDGGPSLLPGVGDSGTRLDAIGDGGTKLLSAVGDGGAKRPATVVGWS